jgi:enamine deaminase RidA (YjgF/YER057c/UK114 family)
MERRHINPWTWQDQFGFVQANELRNAERILVISGQTAIDGNGNVLSAGDMAGQVTACLDNLETVLRQSGMSVENLVRAIFYTTDMDRFLAEAHEALGTRLANVRYATTYLGVSRLAFPELLVEIEATAMA